MLTEYNNIGQWRAGGQAMYTMKFNPHVMANLTMAKERYNPSTPLFFPSLYCHTHMIESWNKFKTAPN